MLLENKMIPSLGVQRGTGQSDVAATLPSECELWRVRLSYCLLILFCQGFFELEPDV